MRNALILFGSYIMNSIKPGKAWCKVTVCKTYCYVLLLSVTIHTHDLIF